MKVLIDLLHPADLHTLRLFREEMLARGHNVVVVARDKDLTIPLLEEYGIPAEILSRQRSGRMGLLAEWILRSARLLKVTVKEKPDVLTGLMGPSIAPVGKIMRVPAIVLYDTENATRTNRFVYPMATAVVTPDCYAGPVRGHHVTYPSYHELAYLHPRRFHPDAEVVRTSGVDPDEWYAIVRFVSWQASHDLGEDGLHETHKRELVEHLSARGRVLITSERALPTDLVRFQIDAPPENIHHLIAHSNIVVGESATMASEAAVLGVPAVFIADTGRGYTDEQESRYGLVRNVVPGDFKGILEAVDDLLGCPESVIAERHQQLISDKLDTTAWLVEYFETRAWETAEGIESEQDPQKSP